MLKLGDLGILIVEVPGMHDRVCFVPTQRVGLIRAGLRDEELERAADFLLFAACTN